VLIVEHAPSASAPIATSTLAASIFVRDAVQHPRKLHQLAIGHSRIAGDPRFEELRRHAQPARELFASE
jgi:hypothetical protein